MVAVGWTIIELCNDPLVGVRAFWGGSCVPLYSVCPFLCEYEPDDRMCFPGAGNMARHRSFGNRGLGQWCW